MRDGPFHRSQVCGTCFIGITVSPIYFNSDVSDVSDVSDKSGSNDHCIVEIMSGPAGKDSDIVSAESIAEVYRGGVTNVSNTTTPMADQSMRFV